VGGGGGGGGPRGGGGGGGGGAPPGGGGGGGGGGRAAVTTAGAVTTEVGPGVDPRHLHGEVGEVHGEARHVGPPLVASQSVWWIDCLYASLLYGL
jgi:hypothetical protein